MTTVLFEAAILNFQPVQFFRFFKEKSSSAGSRYRYEAISTPVESRGREGRIDIFVRRYFSEGFSRDFREQPSSMNRKVFQGSK